MTEALVRLELVGLEKVLDDRGRELAPLVGHDGVAVAVELHHPGLGGQG